MTILGDRPRVARSSYGNRGSANSAVACVEQRRVQRADVQYDGDILRRVGNGGDVRGPVTRFHELDLEGRCIDIRDSTARRIGDPHVPPRGDGGAVGRRHGLLRRKARIGLGPHGERRSASAIVGVVASAGGGDVRVVCRRV